METVPSGDISVIPQAWTTLTPNSCSYASMSERGMADPPTTSARTQEISRGVCFSS